MKPQEIVVEKVPMGLLASLAAVALHGVRLRRNRYRFRGERLARNSPCPCGSGKKFKFCHGK